MKTLNGKSYFEKNDVKNVLMLALTVIDSPYHDQDFLLMVTEDEKHTLRQSIKAFGNSITWEFSSETAISYKKIEAIAQTLQYPASELFTYDQLKQVPIDKVSKLTLQYYENWLSQVGLDITLDEFKKSTHSSK